MSATHPTMTFIHHLDVPRTDDTTFVTTHWVQDDTVSFEARGLLTHLISYPPGETVDRATLREHPDDPPLPEIAAELVDAGYLVPSESNRYELVHPDRLPALPASR